MLPKAFTLEVVTPERHLVHEEAQRLEMPGRDGEIGILPGHAPMITELGAGQLKYHQDGSTHFLCIFGGFAEVLSDRVVVLAEVGERAEEIDVARARQALDRARDRLSRLNDPTIDFERAARAFERATIRMQVAGLGGAPLATEVEHEAAP
jgi:F-type H+-transporting ATPase subunit epsilon